jgi:hypothetical protein
VLLLLLLLVPACRDKVHRKMQRMSRDIRFDDVLANACQADRKSYCPDVQPVSSSSSSRLGCCSSGNWLGYSSSTAVVGWAQQHCG